ncbi:MAG TPA: hypothetical protein GX505_01920 [Clostridiales bacterium]|nr:hypothetical protein [Clostridiales bacterium]
MADWKNQRTAKPGMPKTVALSGILLALTILVLYAESFAPAGRLSLFALSSFFVSVIVCELGIKAGWLFYIGSSLLSFALIPDKIGLLPYILFFGLYGIIKYYAERSRYRLTEFLIKYAFFNLCVFLAYYLARELFTGQLEIKLSPWIIIPVLEITFAIYDYVYSLFIQYYRSRIRKALGL